MGFASKDRRAATEEIGTFIAFLTQDVLRLRPPAAERPSKTIAILRPRALGHYLGIEVQNTQQN